MQRTTVVPTRTELAEVAVRAARRFPSGDGAQVLCADPAGSGFTLGGCPDHPEGPTLIWARWEAGTPGFREVWNYRGALGRETVSTADGDLWVGFRPPAGMAVDEAVEALVEWLVEVHDLLGAVVTPAAG